MPSALEENEMRSDAKGHRFFFHKNYKLPPNLGLYQRDINWTKECLCFEMEGYECMSGNCQPLLKKTQDRLSSYIRELYMPTNSI